MAGAFPRISGRKNLLAKRPRFFFKIISFQYFEVFKGELRVFAMWDGTVLPPNKLQCLFQNPHRHCVLCDNKFSQTLYKCIFWELLCNNKLLVGKWVGFSQAMHLILFTLILMEKFPVSLVGADSVQGWICLNCKVVLSAAVLLNFVPSGSHDLLWESFEHIETNL